MAIKRFSRRERWHLAYLGVVSVLVVVAVVTAMRGQASLLTVATTILVFVGVTASFVMQRRDRQRSTDAEYVPIRDRRTWAFWDDER